MKIVSTASRSVVIVILLAVLPSCALWRGSPGRDGAVVAVELPSELSESEYRALLDNAVHDAITAASGRSTAKFILHKPYFHKTYAEYPDGVNGYTAQMRDTDSRTAPMSADVTISKLRYSTRLQRNREQARQDENYFRDTGTETVSMEFRNGAWRRMGSLFVAERTEEQVGGEWVRIQKDIPAELGEGSAKSGRFSRLKFWQ
jgi:hypothetical protein